MKKNPNDLFASNFFDLWCWSHSFSNISLALILFDKWWIHPILYIGWEVVEFLEYSIFQRYVLTDLMGELRRWKNGSEVRIVEREKWWDTGYDIGKGVFADLWAWNLYRNGKVSLWIEEVISWKCLLQVLLVIVIFSNASNSRLTVSFSMLAMVLFSIGCYFWNGTGDISAFAAVSISSITLFYTYWYPFYHYFFNYLIWYGCSSSFIFALVHGDFYLSFLSLIGVLVVGLVVCVIEDVLMRKE